MDLLFFLNVISAFLLTGVIWTIQIVHYPSFHYIDKLSFTNFHHFHEKKYMGVSKKRIDEYWKNNNNLTASKVNYKVSDVHMTTYNGRICTEYKSLPLCNPDFIYLDGPEQFKVKKDINGISTNHKDMMPMVCDILKFEYFYTPGTIIVCDGRAANAKFLKNHLKRNWKYINDQKNDQK